MNVFFLLANSCEIHSPVAILVKKKDIYQNNLTTQDLTAGRADTKSWESNEPHQCCAH